MLSTPSKTQKKAALCDYSGLVSGFVTFSRQHGVRDAAIEGYLLTQVGVNPKLIRSALSSERADVRGTLTSVVYESQMAEGAGDTACEIMTNAPPDFVVEPSDSASGKP